MIELIKKAFYTGLGAAELTKEKLEEFAKELSDKGKVSDSETRKFIEEVLDRSQERKEQLKRLLEKVSEETMKRMNLASRDDLAALEKRLSEEIHQLNIKGSDE